MHEGVIVHPEAFADCNRLRFIVAPEGYPRDIFPEEATIVTHAEYIAMNNFVPSQRGLQSVEHMHDKMNIYRLCHSSANVTQTDFDALSHLSVSTMLNIIIQAYNAVSHNAEQSKQLLAWTMGTKFVDACGDMEVSKMLGKARGGSDRAPSSVQQFLSVKEWGNMRVVSKDVSESPSAFFHTTPSSRASEAGVPDLGSVSKKRDKPGVADSGSDPKRLKGPSSDKT